MKNHLSNINILIYATVFFLIVLFHIFQYVSNDESARQIAMENKLLIPRAKRTIKGLKQRHPHCFSENLFGGALKNWGNNKTLSLSNIGKYKLVGNNVMSSVSYDHQCRYMLKDRYNCARSKDDDNILGEGPTD